MKWVCLHCTIAVSHAHWAFLSFNFILKVIFLVKIFLVITVLHIITFTLNSFSLCYTFSLTSLIDTEVRTFVWSIVIIERLISISSIGTLKIEDRKPGEGGGRCTLWHQILYRHSLIVVISKDHLVHLRAAENLGKYHIYHSNSLSFLL